MYPALLESSSQPSSPFDPAAALEQLDAVCCRLLHLTELRSVDRAATFHRAVSLAHAKCEGQVHHPRREFSKCVRLSFVALNGNRHGA